MHQQTMRASDGPAGTLGMVFLMLAVGAIAVLLMNGGGSVQDEQSGFTGSHATVRTVGGGTVAPAKYGPAPAFAPAHPITGGTSAPGIGTGQAVAE